MSLSSLIRQQASCWQDLILLGLSRVIQKTQLCPNQSTGSSRVWPGFHRQLESPFSGSHTMTMRIITLQNSSWHVQMAVLKILICMFTRRFLEESQDGLWADVPKTHSRSRWHQFPKKQQNHKRYWYFHHIQMTMWFLWVALLRLCMIRATTWTLLTWHLARMEF